MLMVMVMVMVMVCSSLLQVVFVVQIHNKCNYRTVAVLHSRRFFVSSNWAQWKAKMNWCTGNWRGLIYCFPIAHIS